MVDFIISLLQQTIWTSLEIVQNCVTVADNLFIIIIFCYTYMSINFNHSCATIITSSPNYFTKQLVLEFLKFVVALLCAVCSIYIT